MIIDSIRHKLQVHFKPSILEIMDESHKHKGHAGNQEGQETHFKIRMKSDLFVPLSLLERHKWVHGVLAEEMKKIHALSLNLKP